MRYIFDTFIDKEAYKSIIIDAIYKNYYKDTGIVLTIKDNRIDITSDFKRILLDGTYILILFIIAFQMYNNKDDYVDYIVTIARNNNIFMPFDAIVIDKNNKIFPEHESCFLDSYGTISVISDLFKNELIMQVEKDWKIYFDI